MTPPRWRSVGGLFLLLASCSRSRRFCSSRLRFSASLAPSPRRAARPGSACGASGVSRSASEAPAAIPASTASISATSPETGTWVSCWAARLGAALAAGALALLLLRERGARPCAVRGSWPSPLARLLVRGVVAAPAAELAQLDPVRRVTPRLVGLIVPPLAVFASQRHRDADISASHFSLDSVLTAPLQSKTPGRGARLSQG